MCVLWVSNVTLLHGLPVFKNVYLFGCVRHGLLTVEAHGLSRCGSRARALMLSRPMTCGTLVLRPGIEPASPVLEDGLLTTGPLGIPLRFALFAFAA